MLQKKFDAKVIRPEKKGGLTYIDVPFNAAKEFGGKGRIKVEGTINNQSFRSSLIPKGEGIYILPIDKKMQKDIGLSNDDTLHISMKLDTVVSDTGKPNTYFEKIDKCNLDVLTAIRSRRSIRKFSNKSIDEKTLNTILEMGFCAPSAKNKRPWHFIIIKNKGLLKSLAENDSNHRPIVEADCCILVCGDKNIQGMNDLLYEDCSASIQNMLLASHGLGLGAVWCGFHSGTDTYKYLIDRLNLPLKVVPVAIIALGYPAEDKEVFDRFEMQKVHHEKW